MFILEIIIDKESEYLLSDNAGLCYVLPEHVSPVNPSIHSHAKPLTRSTHCPLFRQTGSAGQSSMSEKHMHRFLVYFSEMC